MEKEKSRYSGLGRWNDRKEFSLGFFDITNQNNNLKWSDGLWVGIFWNATQLNIELLQVRSGTLLFIPVKGCISSRFIVGEKYLTQDK